MTILNSEPGAARGTNSRRLIVLVWLFTLIIMLALAFSYYGIGLLSSVRAFVGGEGQWSKAQKDMVYALGRYGRYHDPDDYQTFQIASEVNLGARKARLELEKPHPDFALARRALLEARNHPDDIDGMIRLFRDFRRVPDIDEAIRLWTEADGELDRLFALAAKIHAAAQVENLPDSEMLPHLRELYEINQRLMPLEDDFSNTLGAAARKTSLTLLLVLFAGVSLLLVIAFLVAGRMVRQSAGIENALRQGERQLRGVLQFTPMPILIVRLADEAFLFANEHALKLLGATPALLDTMQAGQFYVDAEDRKRLMVHLVKHGSIADWEVHMRDAQGMPFWASMSSQCINYHGQECVLTALSNIEVRRHDRQVLHHRAFHDELTTLPNRAMFMETLAERLEHPAPAAFALMFLDVDNFKIINDELGHAIGDKLLQAVASRLRASVAAADFVARLGGDEFIILVMADTRKETLDDKARRIMTAMGRELRLDGHDIQVTISIGIRRFPHDGRDVGSLMKGADLAMYRAKELGRNNWQWHAGGQPLREEACD